MTEKRSGLVAGDGGRVATLGRFLARFLRSVLHGADSYPGAVPVFSAGRADRGPVRPFSSGADEDDGGGQGGRRCPDADEGDDAAPTGGTDRPGFRIAIIGAGISGSLLAVYLLRRCRPDDRVYLIESRAGFGRGLAYSTSNPNHLLNVRAGNMSAFHHDPDHFVAWLATRARDAGRPPPTTDAFVSRQLYGTYIRSLLTQELWAGGKGLNLVLVPDTAQWIGEVNGRLGIETGVGRVWEADIAVLAAGHFPPDHSVGAYFGNPWDADAVAGLDPEARVALIGTGLTMVDVVQSLLDAGHRGPIVALSRRGLLPREHAPTLPEPLAAEELPRTTSVSRLTRWLRLRIALAERQGLDWRAVIDGLRPHVPDLWRRLPIEERRRFLRHLRPWWEVHRHRLAPEIGEMLRATRGRGQLTIRAARVLAIDSGAVSVRLHLRDRRTCLAETLEVARVINCSGPESDYRATRDPLLRALLESGRVRPDPLHLGLETTEEGAVIDTNGVPSTRLYALGPITRGTFWEASAVPDIRFHALRLASHIIGQREPIAAARRLATAG